ncbi:Aste57867_21270 [Aphanomyces stellatus]|uniref:Aste57867_21270 protein n=1 Tax=Aphanomyces stellatus TaxID=120398 RepID=A0A485LHS1_9STRA|nr:hypothetical protein As57867_021201 [Aphanomyces stellatus]VFT97942.1 Aste57867_21270 [Aphanomyces stellatus]
MEAGTEVWVMQTQEWHLAVVHVSTATSITCRVIATNDLLTYTDAEMAAQIHVCNPIEQRSAGVEDLTTLVHLHEPAILNTLHVRFMKQDIYTSTGSILVAVNPFQALPLYTDSIQRRYIDHGNRRVRGEKLSSLPPHVYSVADKAFRDMHETSNPNQSILVSGESGAGKTETTKILMTYLASVSAATTTSTTSPVVDDTDSFIRQRVLESNPILEAFGNAKTTRNNNSSRFGKFIRLGFDAAGSLRGASISTYLLERVRLVSQTVGERNYHIFYELVRGASVDQLAALSLDCVDAYHYLNQSGCDVRQDGVDDGVQFRKTTHAMATLGMDAAAQDHVMRLVAAVLHLGNVAFAPRGEDGARFCSDVSVACGLLGLRADALERGMTTRRIKAGAEYVTVGLVPSLAEVARDVVAKTIYARVFDWLVERINAAIETTHSDRFIGVVDIFGFEIFATNSLEQLCINFANEKLQQLFARFVFEMEQKEYAAEGIPWTFVAYPNNDHCVALVEARPIGLFSLLDEQCLIPRGNDTQLANKYYECFQATTSSRTAAFAASKLHQGKAEFLIHHYAGSVLYSTAGFCDKNKDSVHPEAIELLRASTLPFVTALFTDNTPLRSPPKVSGRGGRGGGASSAAAATSSVVMKFKTQLATLLDLLNATIPHFVRCIKPNDTLHPAEFDAVRVVEQLRCSGVLEAVKISRAGYPVRMPHASFQQQYRILAPRGVDDLPALVTALAALDDLRAVPSPFQLGLTKVFLVQEAYQHLNRLKVLQHARAVRVIQCVARGHLARRRVGRMRRAVVRLQTWVRTVQAQRHLRALRRVARQARAATTIQSCVRRTKCRWAYLRSLAAVGMVQRVVRGHFGRTAAAKRKILVAKAAKAAALVEAARLAQEAREAAAAAVDDAPLPMPPSSSTQKLKVVPSVVEVTSAKALAPLKKDTSLLPVRQISFEEFSDSEEDSSGSTPTESTSSPRSTIPKFRDSEYEISWECGMLGLYFESDETSGLPIVRRVHETLSTCADIFDVSPGDMLLSVGGQKVANNDIRHILKLLKEVQKPVVLRFARTQKSMRESTALMMDEYEVLWQDSVPLGLGFKPDKRKNMPCVSKCRGNPQIPGMFNVRLGDYLTAINEISTFKIEFSRVITLLEEGPRPVVLRFQRADPDDEASSSFVTRDTRMSSSASSRESIASRGTTVVQTSEHSGGGHSMIGGSRPSVRFSERDSMALSRLSVMSLNPKLDDSLYNITWKEEDGALGIVVKQAISSFYPEVTKVKPEGAILRQPNKVSIGDLLVSINNNNISKMGFRNAMHLLQIGPKPVLLTFQKSERTSHVGIPASI